MKRSGLLSRFAMTVGCLALLASATGNEAAVCTPTPTTPEVECVSPEDCEGLYHELCLGGGWQCVDNECTYECDPAPPACPSEPPIGVDPVCASGLECDYGQECCCGECHPSIVCNCLNGQWGCYYTDACMIPFCPCQGNGDCNDWDPCTEDLCDAATGQCLHKDNKDCCTDDDDCGKGFQCQIMVCPGCWCEDPTDPENCPPCLCWGECTPVQPAECVVSGCSGEICAAEPMGSFCVWLDWYECLKLTECGLFGSEGTCAWKPTEAFEDCVLSTPCQGGGACPEGYTCAVSDCTDPSNCSPACSPPPGAGECMASEDCQPGFVCEVTGYCPPCVYMEPACAAPCWAVGECIPPVEAECADLCDCYDLYGMKFEGICPLMCPMCGNFWQCNDGQCVEQCGVIPMGRQDCFSPD